MRLRTAFAQPQCLMQIDVGVEWGVFAGVTDAKNEFAGIDDPFVSRRVPVAEGAGVETKCYVLGFAGSETDFGKALQLALGAVDLRRWVGDVELGDFGSGHVAGVGDVEADRN